LEEEVTPSGRNTTKGQAAGIQGDRPSRLYAVSPRSSCFGKLTKGLGKAAMASVDGLLSGGSTRCSVT